MEPQSGINSYRNHPLTHPPPMFGTHQQSMHNVPIQCSFNAGLCPHPNCSPINKVCGVSRLQIHVFPPPELLPHLECICSAPVYIFSTLYSKRSWKSDKFQLGTWSLAQVVYPSVVFPARPANNSFLSGSLSQCFKTFCPKMSKSGKKLTKIGPKMSKIIQIWSKNDKNSQISQLFLPAQIFSGS